MSKLHLYKKTKTKISGQKVKTNTLISNKAKNARLEIRKGNIRVIIPHHVSNKKEVVKKILESKKQWLEKKLAEHNKQKLIDKHLNKKQKAQHRKKAEKTIPPLVEELASKHKIRFNKVTIRDQKTRWGSCSSLNNISLNWRIILLPKTLQEYVVLHELTHLKHPDHSSSFWSELENICTGAKNYRKKLNKYRLR